MLLQASTEGGLMLPNIIFFASILLISYFFFIRPQVKKQKEQDVFTKALNPGEEIVTTSGIIGKIKSIGDGVIYINLDSKTTIKVLKSAISKELTASYKNPKK